MLYPSILDRKYNEYKPLVEKVAQKVKQALSNFCEDKPKYAFVSRIKTIESLAEKIETGRFAKWSDLDDLFACTVIIPTLSHEKEVKEFCQKAFKITRIVKTRTKSKIS